VVTTSVERRENPRFSCDVEAEVRLEDGRRLPARTQDISFSGICVVTGEKVPQKTRATFALRLVMDWAETEPLELPGVVVWCTRTRDGHQVGARFDPQAMGDDAWQRLDVFLRFLMGDLSMPPADEIDPD